MGFAPTNEAEPVKTKTRPWGENRPMTAPPKEPAEFTVSEIEAIWRIFRGR